MIWKNLLEYVMIAWEKAHKNIDKVTTNDVLKKCNRILREGEGGGEGRNTNSYTIEIALNPCIGTLGHMLLA